MYISLRHFLKFAGDKEAKKAKGLNFDYAQNKLRESGNDYSKESIIKFLEENKEKLPLSDDLLLRIKNLNLDEKERKRVNEQEAFFLIVGTVLTSNSNSEDIDKISLINWFLKAKSFKPGFVSSYFDEQSFKDINTIKDKFLILFSEIKKEENEVAEKNHENESKQKYKSNDIVYQFEDGWRVVYLPAAGEMEEYPGIPGSSFDRVLEGNKNGICLGSKGFLLDGEYSKLFYQTNNEGKIFSIRDTQNESKATIRILDNELKEVTGKFNLAPDLDCIKHIMEWFELLGEKGLEYKDNKDVVKFPPTNKEDALLKLKSDDFAFYYNGIAASWYNKGVKEIDDHIKRMLEIKDNRVFCLAQKYPDLVWPVVQYWCNILYDNFSSTDNLKFPEPIDFSSNNQIEFIIIENFYVEKIFNIYRKKLELIRLVKKLPIFIILDYHLQKIPEFGLTNIDSELMKLAKTEPIYFIKNLSHFNEAKRYIAIAENIALKYYPFELLPILIYRGSDNFFIYAKRILESDPGYFLDTYSKFDWANREVSGKSLVQYAEQILEDPDKKITYNPVGEYYPDPPSDKDIEPEDEDIEPEAEDIESEDEDIEPDYEDYQDFLKKNEMIEPGYEDHFDDDINPNLWDETPSNNDFKDDASDMFKSKNINSLATILNYFGLKKEAAYLAQLQHPDWKDEWEQEEETPEKILNNIFPKEGLKKKLMTEFPEVDPNKLSDIIESKGIKLISFSPKENIGQGSYGTVYDGVFEGKEVAVKLQVCSSFKRSDYAQDVKNIKEIEKRIKNFPENVKRFFPKIYLAEEGEIGLKTYQLIVLEKLYPARKEITNAISGFNKDDRLITMLPDLLNELNSILNTAGIEWVTEKELEPLLIGNFGDQIINIKNFFKDLIENYSKEDVSSKRKYLLFKKIDIIVNKFGEQIFDPFPRWDKNNSKQEYTPTSDIESLWNAIRWLRENGIPAGDIYEENIMTDKQGNLKIADLGAFFK